MNFIRKSISIYTLLLFIGIGGLNAQELFDLPAVICANQRVDLRSKIQFADNYFWHFCAGTITDIPTVSGISPIVGSLPSKAKMVKDQDKFYSFSVNSNGELYRVNLDENFAVTSTTNLSNMAGIFPGTATSIDVVKNEDDGNWFGIVVGYDPLDDEGYVSRIDFGSNIENNSPIGVYFGKSQYMLQPVDVSVTQENGNKIAYCLNTFSNSLSRIDFGSSFYNNPSITDLGATFGLNEPTGMVSFEDGGAKYMVYTNGAGNIGVLDYGTTWTNTPSGYVLGNFNGLVSSPVDITMIRDCGKILFMTKNELNLETIVLEYTGTILGMTAQSLGSIGQTATPRSLTEIIRSSSRIHLLEYDASGNVYEYKYDTCDASYDFQISYDEDPSYVKYYTPGMYTIYHIVDEGELDEQVYCQTFEVLDMPSMSATDDTFICQRDTFSISVIGSGAVDYTWVPDYNITETKLTDTRVYPDSSIYYTCFVTFANGCIVDTSILVEVSRVTADAGPDHTVYDASSINLGGSGTTVNDSGSYHYQWTPGDEVDYPYEAYSSASPTQSGNFILTVTNDYGCIHQDTAKVWVVCDDIHLPNAFSPTSTDPDINVFHILNNALASMEYFRIFNRYGNLMFESTEPEKGWNGMYEGTLQPQDHYVWVVEGICNDGYRVKKQGTVLLLR